jgi:predicted GH43/DUF377 family glycosyl hydrolase
VGRGAVLTTTPARHAPLGATRLAGRLYPDPSRVVARLFVAGQEVVGGSDSRASGVVARILALDEDEVQVRVDELLTRFGSRHRDLVATFSHHADRIGNRIDPDLELSEERWLLLGATFTHEFAVEAASLCNPSMVADPDQSTAGPGELRVIMSVRGIGEGHLSTIGFRTGVVTLAGDVLLDAPEPYPTLGTVDPGVFDRDVFHGRLRALGRDGESAAYVLDHLADSFTSDELEARLALLAGQGDTRRNARATVAMLRTIAACSYGTHFPVDTHLSERVLWPATAVESHGMEDARFVRFVEDDGSVVYYATYTAFDGTDVSQQLLQTTDFVTFASSPMAGPAATGKGLALFPRRVGGRFAALSRHDRETNAIAFSDSLGQWGTAVTIQEPQQDWEVLQLGNSGSPIETASGWLVLTHGVGPMRTYSLGALLLDLEDPTRVLATTVGPVLTPAPDEQDGYVPNVVYTCGALLHGDVLVIPYAIADSSIAVATTSCADLLASMTPIASAGRPSRT